MDITKQIATELQVRPAQVDAAITLLDEGNTVPFISRYRKEATGGLNDEQLRNLSERLTYLRNLEEKKATCLASIEEQGLLTEELKKAIQDKIKEKEQNLVGKMASEGTTPRQLTDLIGSLCDLTSGSGDKGTPVVLVQNYFRNYSED